jgi:formylglycine-generating enzyme required for sulfatase activity/mono/diheme cytochrome c family protein
MMATALLLSGRFGYRVLEAADAPQQLATAAKGVLKNRCFSCHGEGGANEGGFNFALNRKRLVRELVVPGNSDESKLFQRVVKGEMPPDGDKLPKEEIETLRKWIEADAPNFGVETKREFVSPADMLAVMLKDLEKANERDRPFYRYFTLTHLYNAGFEDNELESHRQGLSKLVNSLSWGREVRVPVPVDANKTIVRIDLRHYKWNENEAWSRIVAADPYRVTYSSSAATACYSMTKCELPHVRADWFVFAASRPPLYHVILDIPANVSELEKRLGVDVARNLQDYNDVVRAGFFPSGVSKSNRLIERHVSSYGAYWKSYDFKPADPQQPQRRQNLKANPTGPGGPNGFEHDGGEMIFNLPNGLQAYMLTDAAGKRIDKGPTDVVVDKEAVKRGRDPDVLNGVSCMNCHWSGMLNKTDQIREHVLAQPSAYSANVLEFVKTVYVEKSEFAAKLKEDRARFETAVKRCGMSGLAKSEPVATLAFQFDEPLDLDLAAAEAGVSTDKFVAALRSNAALGRQLGSLPQGQPVQRDTYVQQFASLVHELKVGTALIFREPDKEYVSKSSGMKFVFIPAGEFKMGSTDVDMHNARVKLNSTIFYENELPQHPVKITRPFYMGVYEVTQGDFQTLLGRNTSEFSPTGSHSTAVTSINTSRFPIENVTWFDAIEFCNKLSELDGRLPYYRQTNIERKMDQSIKKSSVTVNGGTGYRLPTEAEWEYACRANTSTLFHFGSEFNNDKANVGIDIYVNGRPTAVDERKYPKNAFGLAQMHGNVFEWCEDVYEPSEYKERSLSTPTLNPLVTTGDQLHVIRGGSYVSSPIECRSASRMRSPPSARSRATGFRVVCWFSP